MTRSPRTRTARAATTPAIALLSSAALIALAAAPVAAANSATRGPSTTTDPYILPAADGVHIKSLLTVDDDGSAGNGYEMVGIPDGLGVTGEVDGIVAYLNHELRDTQGIERRHGQKGAFTARLEIDPGTLAVHHGMDLVDPGVAYWDYPSGTYETAAGAPAFTGGVPQDLTFGRWCSGTLSDPGLFWSNSKKVGYGGQIWFGNEEDDDNGRVFGVTTDGTAQALPRLGLFSWENTVPADNKHETTLVMGQEDGPRTGSQLWVYVGTKQSSGSAFDRAGLTNGADFVVDAVNQAVTNDAEWRAAYPKGVPAAVTLNEVPWNQSGAAQNAEALAEGLALNRVEDGYWNPNRPNDFYFLTTEGGDKATTFPYTRDGGGLWLLRWRNIEKPEKGATLTLLLDGTESIGAGEPKMNKPDNMTIDTHGNLLIQEDPGSNAHLARIVAYRISDGALGVVARYDANLFGAGSPSLLTIDEESSGVIDAERLMGPGAFFLDAQAHTATGLTPGMGAGTQEEFVEHGQLLFMRITSWAAIYGD